jgi:hypothetical protein
MATAFHQPEKLQEIFKPTVSETLHQAQHDPGQWESDKWWESESEN